MEFSASGRAFTIGLGNYKLHFVSKFWQKYIFISKHSLFLSLTYQHIFFILFVVENVYYRTFYY